MSENASVSEAIISSCIQVVNDLDSPNLDPYIRLLGDMISVEDSLTKSRVRISMISFDEKGYRNITRSILIPTLGHFRRKRRCLH